MGALKPASNSFPLACLALNEFYAAVGNCNTGIRIGGALFRCRGYLAGDSYSPVARIDRAYLVNSQWRIDTAP